MNVFIVYDAMLKVYTRSRLIKIKHFMLLSKQSVNLQLQTVHNKMYYSTNMYYLYYSTIRLSEVKQKCAAMLNFIKANQRISSNIVADCYSPKQIKAESNNVFHFLVPYIR